MAEGIVAGGGVALMHAAPVLDELNVVDDYATGVEIVRRALTEPTYLIATNAGYPGHEVVAEVAKMDLDEGFDALAGRYGNMIEMGIIDPLRVCRSALQNGASVAGLLLTTNTLIAEEQTAVGRQPVADDRVRPARRGPAPALARLEHPAVARARPVRRMTEQPMSTDDPSEPARALPSYDAWRARARPRWGRWSRRSRSCRWCCAAASDWSPRSARRRGRTRWSSRPSGRRRCSPTPAASATGRRARRCARRT